MMKMAGKMNRFVKTKIAVSILCAKCGKELYYPDMYQVTPRGLKPGQVGYEWRCRQHAPRRMRVKRNA